MRYNAGIKLSENHVLQPLIDEYAEEGIIALKSLNNGFKEFYRSIKYHAKENYKTIAGVSFNDYKINMECRCFLYKLLSGSFELTVDSYAGF